MFAIKAKKTLRDGSEGELLDTGWRFPERAQAVQFLDELIVGLEAGGRNDEQNYWWVRDEEEVTQYSIWGEHSSVSFR